MYMYRFLVMEVYSTDVNDLMKYYASGADMPFNFGFIAANSECGGTCFRQIVETWMDNMPGDKWPNFVVMFTRPFTAIARWLVLLQYKRLQLGNHDQRRITTRKDPKFAEALNTMLLLLPGTPTTYQGEEIAQLDIAPPSPSEAQDPWGSRLGEVVEKVNINV